MVMMDEKPKSPSTKSSFLPIGKQFFGYLVVGLLAGVLGAAFYGYFARHDTGFLEPSTTTEKAVTVSEQSAIIDLAKNVSPSVVSITSSANAVDFFGQDQTETGAGTGMIVSSDGLILTNKHVVAGATSLTVITADSKQYTGTIVAQDPTNDIAFVKVNAHGLKAAVLGDSSVVQVGQSVVAIGNALGQFQNSVTAGIISGERQSITAGEETGGQEETLSNLFQTDAAINPGNSGGPLVNIAGQVIGMNTAVAGSAQNIGFAIPINDIKNDLTSVEDNGKIQRPQLGVRYVPITQSFATSNNLPVTQGAYIAAGSDGPAVVPGSAADKAGLQAGDIIAKIGSQTIDQNHTLATLIGQHKIGDKISVTYLRGGKTTTVTVTLEQGSS